MARITDTHNARARHGRHVSVSSSSSFSSSRQSSPASPTLPPQPSLLTDSQILAAEREDFAAVAELFSDPAEPLEAELFSDPAEPLESTVPIDPVEIHGDGDVLYDTDDSFIVDSPPAATQNVLAAPSPRGRLSVPASSPPSLDTHSRPGPSQVKRSRGRKRVRSARSVSPAKKVSYTYEQSNDIMRCILQCKREGMLRSTKKADRTPVWERVSDEINLAYRNSSPPLVTTPKNIESKFDNERRRYKLWKAFSLQSGVTYNDETGLLCTDSEDRWEHFKTRFRRSQSLDWLRSTRLGDKDVYEELFFGETVEGSGIVGIHAATTENVSPTPPKPSRKRKRREDPTDPDTNNTLPSDLIQFDSNLSGGEDFKIRKSHRKNSAMLTATANLRIAAQSLSAPRRPGDSDVATATSDFMRRFGRTMAPNDVQKCLDKLRDERDAVIWNNINVDEVKQVYINTWIAK